MIQELGNEDIEEIENQEGKYHCRTCNVVVNQEDIKNHLNLLHGKSIELYLYQNNLLNV